MTAAFIILTGIIIALLTASWILDKKDRIMPIFWAITLLLFLMGLAILSEKDGTYRDGQADALDGKFLYERRFVIPEGDTIITDTLYVKL